MRKKFGYTLAITAINVRRVLKYAQEDAKQALDLLVSSLIQAMYVKYAPISHIELNLAFCLCSLLMNTKSAVSKIGYFV
ncbi:hypothetical protein [Allobaculum mucilyticum]|uniref:hypothetical protein n=1 Tax=Allobaculum mucilyticum TaxID=2834459 RepID=UPI001F605F5B|nr:hypothetical protein [Allobaculum mucilyticum]UNT96590.1 hypothetical protein KWG62_02175 [Allobaculum mucilyticum]